jgi:hypothetical protein
MKVYYKVRTAHKTSKPLSRDEAFTLSEKWQNDYKYVEVIKYDSRGNIKIVASTM